MTAPLTGYRMYVLQSSKRLCLCALTVFSDFRSTTFGPHGPADFAPQITTNEAHIPYTCTRFFNPQPGMNMPVLNDAPLHVYAAMPTAAAAYAAATLAAATTTTTAAKTPAGIDISSKERI